ncbi:MAG: hypothetical protein M0Z51_08200 [Propionibacterium sp.]|nr:hypothetical protein [Propionibacterium sp.]
MSVLLIADVRDWLGIPSAQTPDGDVQMLIDWAEGMVSDRVGPLAPTTVVYSSTVVSGRIPLPNSRVLSVTSVTSPWFAPIDPTSVVVVNGVLEMIYGVIPASIWTVTYSAGWPTGGLPPQVYAACLEQCRHLFMQKRGSTMRPATEPAPGTYHGMPWRVEEMLQPYALTGGLA